MRRARCTSSVLAILAECVGHVIIIVAWVAGLLGLFFRVVPAIVQADLALRRPKTGLYVQPAGGEQFSSWAEWLILMLPVVYALLATLLSAWLVRVMFGFTEFTSFALFCHLALAVMFLVVTGISIHLTTNQYGQPDYGPAIGFGLGVTALLWLGIGSGLAFVRIFRQPALTH